MSTPKAMVSLLGQVAHRGGCGKRALHAGRYKRAKVALWEGRVVWHCSRLQSRAGWA